MSLRTWYPLLWLIASAAVYAIAYDVPPYAWPLACVALIPLFAVIRRTASLRRVFWYGLGYGTVLFGGILFYLLTSDLSNQPGGWRMLITMWLVTILLGGFSFAILALLLKRFMRGGWQDFLTIPSLWILMEFVRAYAFSALFLGSQSSLSPGWTVGNLGYPLIWSGLFAPLAPIGGAYLLSFVGVSVNYALFTARERPHQSFAALLVLLILFSGAYDLQQLGVSARASEGSVSAALITTDFPPRSGDLTVGRELASLLPQAVRTRPDVIVFPEGSRALFYLGTSSADRLLTQEGRPMSLIDSDVVDAGAGTYARLISYAAGGVIDTSDKAFLMPYGEYLPYLPALFSHAFGLDGQSGDVRASFPFQKGTTRLLHTAQGYPVGALTCSEIIPESLYRNLAVEGAQVFINAASQSSFHGDAIPYYQILSSAKMKSLAHDRFFLQAGNEIPSFMMDNRGSLREESTYGERGVLAVTAERRSTETWYTRFGDWPLALALGILALALIFRPKDRIRCL